MTALMGVMAIVVDVAHFYVVREQLQAAVDVAALAAGQDLPDTAQAAATAVHYVQRNSGSAAAEVTFPDAETITVVGSRTVDYIFGRVLGLRSQTVRASATAAVGSAAPAFDYTLFSGSNTAALTLNGSNQYVDGDVHTNRNFDANGSKLTITGVVEAVTTIQTNGSQIAIGERAPGAGFLPMPDFATTVKAEAQDAGTYFRGDKSFSSYQVVVSSPVYVEGNVTVNGSHFTGRGSIVATGSITFNGSSLKANATDALAFYSVGGSITINGSGATVDGILYAPNGVITMNGSDQTVHGRVIGNTVNINGSQLTIAGSPGDVRALPAAVVKLVH